MGETSGFIAGVGVDVGAGASASVAGAEGVKVKADTDGAGGADIGTEIGDGAEVDSVVANVGVAVNVVGAGLVARGRIVNRDDIFLPHHSSGLISRFFIGLTLSSVLTS